MIYHNNNNPIDLLWRIDFVPENLLTNNGSTTQFLNELAILPTFQYVKQLAQQLCLAIQKKQLRILL